jgi:hypothetical protein
MEVCVSCLPVSLALLINSLSPSPPPLPGCLAVRGDRVVMASEFLSSASRSAWTSGREEGLLVRGGWVRLFSGTAAECDVARFKLFVSSHYIVSRDHAQHLIAQGNNFGTMGKMEREDG